MLFVLFRLEDDRYALDALRVAEILPMVGVKQLPQAPAGVAGIIDYHGKPVPLVDLSQLALDRPARRLLSTRIILVNFPDGDGMTRLLGLLAEEVTETMRRDPADFAASGVGNDAAPYLGPVAADANGLIQWVDPDKLLPAPIREQLFKQPAGA